MFKSRRLYEILNKVPQVLVVIYQGLALVIFLTVPFFAWIWFKTPFIGAFVEQTLVINGVGQKDGSATWKLLADNPGFGNQVIQISGTEIHASTEMQQVLEKHLPGDALPVVIRKIDGSIETYTVTLHTFPQDGLLPYLYLPLLISFVYLGVSLWIFGLRRSEAPGRAFALFASSLSIGSGALFNLYTSHQWTYMWTFALGIGGGALFDLALAFPQEARLVIRRPYLRWMGYIVALALVGYASITLNNFAQPTAYAAAWRYLYIFDGSMMLFLIGRMLLHAFTSKSPIIQNQAKTILWGAIISFSPITLWLLIAPFWTKITFNPYLFLPAIVFPVVTGYTILRYRLLQIDYLLSRGILYALLTILAVGGYALLVSGLGLIFSNLVPNNPYLIGLMVLALVVLLNPVRVRLQRVIDGLFFRGESAYQQRMQNFSHELTSTLALPDILRALREHIIASLIPTQLHIYTYDLLNDQYAAAAGEDGRPTSDIRFAVNNPLVQRLNKERLPIYTDGINLPADLLSERSRLALLGAHLFIALPGREHPIGWLALGPRHSGQPYTTQDLNFLNNLGDQVAVAIGRVQIVANLERRVQEMNTLSRVSQGVNITLTFDDVLELIYAQTSQIIPSSDFHITLHNRAGDYFYYAFCLEENERLAERENSPLPPNQGLGQEVIRKGRPILTQNYTRECQIHNANPYPQGVHAWMGVPLNAGAEAIGSLSVATRDKNITYTKGQLDLLQAIADQTAGAIVKARLLQETQQRAHQLSTLNEITRQLTSTLEHEPLLQNILENAVGILNCEAGSLFLVDEQTNEMIFKVTVGPVASNLLGQRMPAGSGIVGKAIETRAPVIANDVTSSPSWFANTDQQTGFVTRAILAVPLQVKERVIGVVEVINKRDALPFVEDDQTLLTAFAGQAAVAIENARLYTLTDQELAARVEELSVMQRIDRELNASLEMDRAMRITLEWAMRKSNVEAGLIGMLDEKGLRLMTQQGYGEQLAAYAETPLPLEQPELKAAIESGQPQHVIFQPEEKGGFLPDTRSQIIVPIRREAKVIGLLLLESTAEAQEDLAFLNRLSDHAAIAISNAQLYAEVQAANLSKSEFVSLVAHELNQPMTSIKGYTELLAAGSVGAINEMQTNFLNTIHSNVERMSTMVSDLNDQSKIEAGRLRLDFKVVKLDEVVDDIVSSTKRQTDEKHQNVTVKLPKKMPKVWVDRTRLGQIITNLVSNANKYTLEGGDIFIGAQATDNQWDPEGASKVVHIWVKDNGIGISMEDQKNIFQKFFRSEDEKARETPGTGLGLNITKSLVEMQGGRIWFESEYRQGSTFHFTVPVAEG